MDNNLVFIFLSLHETERQMSVRSSLNAFDSKNVPGFPDHAALASGLEVPDASSRKQDGSGEVNAGLQRSMTERR
jgi:hypothetical protein